MSAPDNNGPIFVVGQPRSGSTLITRILNDVPGLFLINDFYVLQKIDAENLWGPLSSDEAHRVASWIYRIIEIRATEEVGKTLDQSIHLEMNELASLKTFVEQEWASDLRWHQVLNAVMKKAAALAGCQRWGYNTPQDHLHLKRLIEAFPAAKAIFLLRQPEAVLKSYKNVSGWWHDPRRYNPVTIALAWRAAAQSYERWQTDQADQVILLKYEDLVDKTDETITRLTSFLSVLFPEVDLPSYGRNSSHADGKSRRQVTETEIWLSERIIGDYQTRLGFSRSPQAGISPAGVLATVKTLFHSLHLLFDEYLFDKDHRRRLVRLVWKS